ncbi:MAG: FkbM family methyltransferase [Lachnospiraceae bacterium]|nr:FkbM family methyltransferase [Lachnospiraceae bacterium]
MELLNQIKRFPENVELLGILDDDSSKWGGYIGSPQILQAVKFDKIIIPSEVRFNEIKDNLMYWHHIDEEKIENKLYLLKIMMVEKYKDSADVEIQEILKYWENNGISVFNQYVSKGKEKHIVQWDCIENMPYIIFEDKRMYFPYDHRFPVVDGQKVVMDILGEQQSTSPHLYIKDDIGVEQGDVVADAGVCEGNFSLRYVEKASKLYLFECNWRWIKPLQKTFEKFRDKVVLCNKFLGRYEKGEYTTLDSVIDGRLDFLKMDIEGAEEEALLGGENTLLDNNVKCAICSYHKPEAEMAIKDILQKYGYNANSSNGYMVFYWDKNIYSTLDFRRGIVYARK